MARAQRPLNCLLRGKAIVHLSLTRLTQLGLPKTDHAGRTIQETHEDPNSIPLLDWALQDLLRHQGLDVQVTPVHSNLSSRRYVKNDHGYVYDRELSTYLFNGYFSLKKTVFCNVMDSQSRQGRLGKDLALARTLLTGRAAVAP
jgi:hypothetical protein